MWQRHGFLHAQILMGHVIHQSALQATRKAMKNAVSCPLIVCKSCEELEMRDALWTFANPLLQGRTIVLFAKLWRYDSQDIGTSNADPKLVKVPLTVRDFWDCDGLLRIEDSKETFSYLKVTSSLDSRNCRMR
jgi:hypothetical protein